MAKYQLHVAPRTNAEHRRGFVLFIVVIVIVMVTLAGATFVLTLSTENRAAHIHGQQLQLEHVLASGEEWLKAVCEQPPAVREESGGLLDNAELFQGIQVAGADDTEWAGSFQVISPSDPEGAADGVRYGLQDESAKLNLAVLLQWEQDHPGAAAAALLNLPGMTEPMADAILDWLDGDDTPRRAGAEQDYYSGRGLPYSPRNGIPASLDELLLIRDVSRIHLFGADRDMNYQVDSDEQAAAAAAPGGATPSGDAPWASLLTMYGAERNIAADGQPRIDLNQADLAALHDQLNEVFQEEWTRFIIAYRQFGPYRDGANPRPAGRRSRDRGSSSRSSPRESRRVRTGLGPSPELDLTVPAKFKFDSVLDVIGGRVLMAEPEELWTEEEFEAMTMESPFADDTVQLAKYLPDLLDRTTVTADEVIHGRVNVNLAPRAVLLGVPGIDPKIVDQILSTRRGAMDDGGGSVAWLLTEGIVDVGGMKAVLPFVTGRGDVFRAQIFAQSGTSDLTIRAELVIDATITPTRQLYWKDLSLLGRGFAAGNEEPNGMEAEWSDE